MTTPRFECCLFFSRELNPDLEADPSEKRRKQALRAKTEVNVRIFLFDHIRPEYRGSYPDTGIEVTSNYMTGPSSELLVAEIFLPPHRQMAELTASLQRLLIKKLVHELPALEQRLTVTVGPISKAAA